MASDRSLLLDIAREAMLTRGVEPEFSPGALAQVAAVHTGYPAADGRRDLRDLPWCSIDNDDSRDLDQLSVARVTQGGGVTILVAIADVDALVPGDSPVDRHASRNTTSVYTGAQVFPMLPERLSTDLTSLNEGEDRATVACSTVGPWLEGTDPMPAGIRRVPALEDNLRRQDAAAQALQRRRHEEGALTLATT